MDTTSATAPVKVSGVAATANIKLGGASSPGDGDISTC